MATKTSHKKGKGPNSEAVDFKLMRLLKIKVIRSDYCDNLAKLINRSER